MPPFARWTADSALEEASSRSERARWARLKAFPQLLQPGPDGLTPEQERAIELHQILDDGRAYCAACRTLVPEGDHCGECGAVLRPKPERPAMDCPNSDCDVVTTCRFCPQCGSRVLGEISERIWRGELKVGDLVMQLTQKRWAEKDAAAARQQEVADHGPDE